MAKVFPVLVEVGRVMSSMRQVDEVSNGAEEKPSTETILVEVANLHSVDW